MVLFIINMDITHFIHISQIKVTVSFVYGK